MVSLVCSKVTREVMKVRREVLPSRPGYAATVSNAKLNQPYHSEPSRVGDHQDVPIGIGNPELTARGVERILDRPSVHATLDQHELSPPDVSHAQTGSISLFAS